MSMMHLAKKIQCNVVNTVVLDVLAKDCGLDKVVFHEARIFVGFWCISKDCF